MNKREKTRESRGRVRLHSFDALLALAQSMHLIFVLDTEGRVDIYAPNQKLSMPLRRSVYKFNRALQQLLVRCDKAVCPARALHRRHWRTNTGVCRVCLRIEQSFSRSSTVESIAS